MSAENQNTAAPSQPVVEGPREIVFEAVPVEKAEVVEKVETPVAAPKTETPSTDPEGDSGLDDDSQQDNRDSKGRFKPGVQSRIDELTRSRREAERDAAYWKARALGDSAPNPARPAEKAKPPVLSDFETQEDYLEAVAEYKIDSVLASKDAEKQKTKEVTDRATSWQTRLDTARAATPDYNEVMDAADIPVADHVADLLFEHELGANLAYHFAKNPDVLTKLNDMSPAKAAFEIGKIGDKLGSTAQPSSEPKSAPKVIEKPTSNAPPPAKPLGQGRATAPTLEEMSMEDYVATRKAQKASWAR